MGTRDAVRLVIVIFCWLICGAFTAIAWHDMYRSVFVLDGAGLFPTGIMGIMWILSGLAVGLAGNGIADVLAASER